MSNDEQPRDSGPGLAGAAIAAGLFGVCCALPAVLGGLGFSAIALSEFFEPMRPYLLAAGVVVLGVGISWASVRVASARRARQRRLGGPLLLLAAVVASGAGFSSSGCSVAERDTAAEEAEVVTFIVDGMMKSRSGAT